MVKRETTVVAVLSLEPWDDVWRRNQHLASALVERLLVDEVVFVEPPVRGRRGSSRRVAPGVEVVTPPLPAPRRAGGLALTAAWLRATHLGRTTHLWVNDAPLGALCLRAGQPTLYDVTDDWRYSKQPERVRRRLISAEGRLASNVGTVVCSPALQRRWQERYAVEAVLVPNAIEERAWLDVVPLEPPGTAPHVGYVGTLHDDRLDVPLVLALADALAGTLHLVGPDHLTQKSRRRLAAAGVALHGPVSSSAVPGWTKAMDVLICPHVVTDFTLSLDAIKAYEYAASERPVVATPTSGFQGAAESGVRVLADRRAFVRAVTDLVAPGRPPAVARPFETWGGRAEAFARALLDAPPPRPRLPPAPAVPVRLRRRATRELRWALANVRSPRVRFGPGTTVGAGLQLAIEGEGRIWFGQDCVLDRGAVLHAAGDLVVGDRTIIGHHASLAAKQSVRIGRNCMLAEMVSVRDHDHRFEDLDTPIRDQGAVSAPVVIEDDVWLGGGVVVTAGVRIGRGTVVGARSVVTGDLPAGVVAVGAPARVVRDRVVPR